MGTDIEDMTVNCATGNCTWPIIPTVGVCGACVDTTESIRVDLVPEIGLCNVTAPGNLTLRGSCNLQDFGPIMTIGPGTGEVFSRLDEAPPSSDALPVITQFGILGLPQMMPANTTINNSIATECGLWYCVQARKIWVDQGELHDEIVETSFTTQEIDSEVTLEAQRNGRINFTDIPSSFNTDPGEHYGIHVREMFALDKYFASILLGNVTMDGGLGVATPTTDFAEAAHIGLNDIDAWIQRLAKSMTNNIRTIGYVQTGTQELSGENAQPMPDKQPVPDIARYEGTARSNQVFFIVYWSWLAYPAAMVALTTLYLGFEATRTALLQDIRPWKDDTMMPLSMSLDEHSREVAREGLVEPKGARERLGRLEMTITRGDKGFPSGFVVREH
jgi:Zn-finger nucleic acid-binding protein